METQREEVVIDWKEMPTEALLNILSYLTPRELCQATTVSKAFQQLVEGTLFLCYRTGKCLILLTIRRCAVAEYLFRKHQLRSERARRN